MFSLFNEDLRYAYSAGEIKVMENKLLNRHALKRLLAAKGLEEISAILTEAGYQLPEETKGVLLDTEEFLLFNLARLYKIVKKFSFHPEITDLFAIRYDFRNFGVLLKKKLAQEKVKDKEIRENEVLVNLGLHGLNTLKESFENRNYDIYPEKMAEIFLKVEKKASGANLETIGRILDKEYFGLAQETTTANNFCQYIFGMFIDFENLKTAWRLKKIEKEVNSLKESYIYGGKVPLADFIDFFNERINSTKLFSRYEYRAIFTSGDDEKLDLMERNLDNLSMDVFKEIKFSSIGLELLIVYLLVKEKEIENLRRVLQGKSAGLSEEELWPYLRKTYV